MSAPSASPSVASPTGQTGAGRESPLASPPAAYGLLREMGVGLPAGSAPGGVGAGGSPRAPAQFEQPFKFSGPLIFPAAVAWAKAGGADPEAGDIRRRMIAVLALNGFRLARLRPLFEAFEARGLRWAALKGLDHLARLYPGLEWRPMVDVDVLVHPEDFGAARELAAGHGFGRVEPRTTWLSHALTYTDGEVKLDLHWRPNRPCTHRVPVAELLEGTRLTTLEGAPLRLLAPVPAFLAHALVIARDRLSPWSVNPVRLVEITLLEDLLSAEEVGRCRERMEAWRARRAYERVREATSWVRAGGDAPAWWRRESRDRDLPGTYWVRIRDTARLQDNPWEALRFVAAEVGTSAIRALTLRRLGVLR